MSTQLSATLISDKCQFPDCASVDRVKFAYPLPSLYPDQSRVCFEAHILYFKRPLAFIGR